MQFILGYQNNVECVPVNISVFTDMQDAARSCSYMCAVYAANLEAAKIKFHTLWEKENKPVAKILPVGIQPDHEASAADFLYKLYQRMIKAHEYNPGQTILGRCLFLHWEDEIKLQEAMEDALGVPHRKLESTMV